MQPELIVIAGSLVGERFALGAQELRIGRSPEADIQLAEKGAAWDHCAIRAHDGGFQVVDRHTGAGTYLNGMRIREERLEHGDQIAIGETVLVYQDRAPDVAADSKQTVLLRACSLLFLFRALAMSRNDTQRATLEVQLIRLIGDLVPSIGGSVVLGGQPAAEPVNGLCLPLYVRGEAV